MNCMKCGREVPSGQAFCDTCLAEMKKYPVNPDTVIQLPTAKSHPTPRKATVRRKAILSEQEQIRRLKTRLRRLWTALIILLVLMITLGCLAADTLLKSRRPLLGQNYSTIPQKTTSAEK